MRATDFDFSKDLVLSPDKGMITFHNSRLVIFDAEAIGLLRQSMLDEFGWQKTREMFLRLGYRNGYSDHLQMRVNYVFDSEFELLAAGPAIHCWEGIVRAVPGDMSYDRDKGTFRFVGVWNNSYEAEQFLSFNPVATEPVCWSLTGYASGWCTAFFGQPLLAMESTCVGRGDERCQWLIQPPAAWGDEAAPYSSAFARFHKG
jgi:hypothetical protein